MNLERDVSALQDKIKLKKRTLVRIAEASFVIKKEAVQLEE